MTLEGRNVGIYRVGKELGRGGMGAVYRAETTADGPAGPAGTAVALKIFHSELLADERAFARCKLEAEIGKEIRHGNLVRTYGISSSELDGQPTAFMVMELIEGKTLKGLLKELGTFPERLLHEVADQVLAALHEIHERGVVHRDLKPENIVVTPDQRVLLMDLGVARRESGHEMTRAGEFLGSLAYAPPEQFTTTDVGRRADLYALGITLYELATGRNPFPQADLPTLLRAKLEEEIPPPRSVVPDLDPFWDQVIATCVKREKADRFATADELRRILRDGERSEWWRVRGAVSAEPALRRLRMERRTPLFGRATEMEALRGAYAAAREKGAVLLVTGPSGAGKSRLLFDFLEGVAGAGGPAIGAGRGAGAGSVAYGPFLEALGDLTGGGAGEGIARMLADMPGAIEPFRGFLKGALQPGPESGLTKEALFAAVVKILRGLAAERPLVLVIEDLHLAGAESAELFAHAARFAPGAPLLLCAVWSDDDLWDSSPLRKIAGTALPVANLRDAPCEELVRFVTREERTVRAVAPTLFSKSEGNPFLVQEALAHLVATGVLKEADGRLEVARPFDDTAVPSSVRDLAALRLAALTDEERETVEVASILGSRFEAPLLADVLGVKPIELLQRLAVLDRKHRLVLGAGEDLFRFARRQIHEAIYGGIPEALRTEYHSLIADALLGEGETPLGERAYALLRHLLAAERAPEALPFLESALDFMSANFHASYAAPFLEKVALALAPAAPPKRLAIAMKLWAFYDLLASRKDQMRVLDDARKLAEAAGDPAARARVHALRAGTHWYFGDYVKAGEEAQAGLALAREAGDRKWAATCTHTLGVVAYRHGRLTECAALWRDALQARREIGDRVGQASTLQALALVLPSLGEGAAVPDTLREALGLWRESGDRRGEAITLMNLGNHLVDTGRPADGLARLEEALVGHRETGAFLYEALCLANLGRAQEMHGWVDEARASWARALGLFTELGDPNGQLAVRIMVGSVLGMYGEGEEARGHLEAAIELAGRTGARTKLAMAHRFLGELQHGEGQRDGAWTHFREALAIEEETKNATGRVLTLAALGNAALAEGDHDGAARYLADALDGARTASDAQLPVVLARLARAHLAAGRAGEARELAREALQRLEAPGGASTKEGPEVYFALSEVHEDALRRSEFLLKAKEIVEERAGRIRNGGYREHYLTRTWPNSAILARQP